MNLSRKLIARVRRGLLNGDQRDLGAILDDAVNRGALEEVRELLDLGVHPDTRDVLGDTPLMNAAWVGCPEVAALLVARGAAVSATGADGRTALERLASVAEGRHAGHDAVVAILQEAGAGE